MATDLPLLSQFWTASRLNVSSNLRRGLTAVVFMGFLVYCSPYSPSVNSKQPHFGAAGEDEKEDEDEKSPILSRKQGRRFADFVAGGQSAPGRGVEFVRCAGQTELRVNFHRRAGQKRPQQNGQHPAGFRQVVEHFVEPFGLRRVLGQAERLSLVHVLIGAGDQSPDVLQSGLKLG